MGIAFKKMVGTGNDFIMIDNRNKEFPVSDKDFIVRICTRHYGIGSDGIILLEDSDKADFKMRIINPDSSEVEMCGNGSRCAVRMARDVGLFKAESASVETIAGLLQGSIKDELVRINMGQSKDIRKDLKIDLDGDATAYFINTGVPHVVVFVEDVSKVQVSKWGRIIREHELFSPKGTNANFVEIVDKDTIKVRTYERGVEDETFSCGTGTCASAIMAHLIKGTSINIKSITAKNENLFVDFNVDDKGQIGTFFLSGPAEYVFEGTIKY
ncbi:MAG: diaminopimelate epimerase [Candidatus Aureabacteria bacterium]|nr:diaminopimelate epimerase [Candidatus Auribacterota bacterium]